ncbi:DUF1569 domain-containing protein [Stieleria varia]|uniref:DUF1569 domain-containing protein n=1 Tax=Stieleria varia TaxID=2528005 RepID=UPI0011B79222|nr:DUF1569 domain-containing protein [Stieleria varia]
MSVHFRTIDELQSFVEMIREDNHETLGQWSAAQNFAHLAGAFEGSMQQLPAGYPRIVRIMLRPFRSIVTKYRFPPWLPIPAAIKHRLEPPVDALFDEQKSRLLDSIREFCSHDSEHPPHPVLGRLTRDEWIGFHLRHSAHHLSFIRIKE